MDEQYSKSSKGALQPPPQKKPIQSTEWLLVSSLLLIMASLVLISKVNAYRTASALSEKDFQVERVAVTVEGAVANPGKFYVPSGSSVGSVLKKARPLRDADLQNIFESQLVEQDVTFKVEKLSELTVSVSGAVELPVELKLPLGSRICDLKSKLKLTPEADKTYFRRRKLLINGQQIEVPKKSVE